MDIEKVNRIPLPAGERGSFLVTNEMLRNIAHDDLRLLDDLIVARQVELGVNLIWSISEERQGFRITWRPQ